VAKDDPDQLAQLMGDQALMAWTAQLLIPPIRRLIEIKVGKAVTDATAPLHQRIRQLEQELARTKANIRALGEAA
jgi:hypothetical protein